MTKMNPEIKAQWVDALRSGEREQGNGALNRDGKFCCLGVLCDLAARAGIVSGISGIGSRAHEVAYGNDYEHAREAGNALTLPQSVMNWAGLDTDNPTVGREDFSYDTAAAYLNDNGTTFLQLADLIEANL